MTKNVVFNLKQKWVDRRNWEKSKTNSILLKNSMYVSRVRLFL